VRFSAKCSAYWRVTLHSRSTGCTLYHISYKKSSDNPGIKRLSTPGTVRRSTEAYQQEMNPLGEFFSQCCKFHKDAWVPVSELRNNYERFCRENGETFVLNTRKFNERVREAGTTLSCCAENTGSGVLPAPPFSTRPAQQLCRWCEFNACVSY
jgi:hypothetical protein